ncbi:uncharacterized protein LOC122503416 [Leptopilina heterotoma]|uniref:uncharacterized protein LOC122503416 n=1 Tax=Leptopilina heterotoma TaxID=63436 RepID=UPI001CAA096F|nr:uncharacterized protein LOC122503416 [Leptopilina heterotoma]
MTIQNSSMVLLATAIVMATSDNLEQHVARVLCDPGSQISLITERLANSLHLRRTRCEVEVEGVGASVNTRTKGLVSVQLHSTHHDFSMTLIALVIPTITSITPTLRVNCKQWKHLTNLNLADPNFGIPSGIDILLGADSWGLIVEADLIRGKSNEEPFAQRTKFGWVVFGPTSQISANHSTQKTFNVYVKEDDDNLSDLLQAFWKLEEVPEGNHVNDNDCELLFSTTFKRTSNGRYCVNIPFRSDALALGGSYRQALRQFYSMERRMTTDEEFRANYLSFMREYLALDHMEPCDQPGDHENCYYIPHHAVTVKFRVVFNASARTTTGVSLNDIQLVGPTLQESLLNIIFRFRRYRIALNADIEKMFRQTLITPEHRDFQRIVWRESPEEPIGIYRLKTVTYGMASSPYLAVRALNQCANDNFHQVADPIRAEIARQAILDSFYVDDFLTSARTTTLAVQLSKDVSTILSVGQLNLRKWNSNDPAVIEQITGEAASPVPLTVNSVCTSVLGLLWDPVTDELLYSIDFPQCNDQPTKRRVLSAIARLFDPTGLVAPVIITAKIFIQSLWLSGIDWDTPLPEDLAKEWNIFCNGLSELQHLRVPRWVGMEETEQTMFYGFCDASTRAYAAVIYTRTVDENGQVKIGLLTAKTKVAPKKGATIPRLELCAAQLLASTWDNVRTSLRIQDTSCFLWSDSRIVLCWLNKQPSQLKPYVANRVRQIQSLTTPSQWHHVRTTENPADCASRGLKATDLLKHKLWWQGPQWLNSGFLEQEESTQPSVSDLIDVQEEERISVLMAVTHSHTLSITTRQLDGELIPLITRFSNLRRLLGTMALVRRWSPSRKHLLHQSIISARELDTALDHLIRVEQSQAFSVELNALRKNLPLPSTSRLASLNPYVDDTRILRLGGRIRNASLPVGSRFPIILPKDGLLAKLLIQQSHIDTLHGGAQLMLQNLRSRYWILQARQAAKRCINQCIICRRFRGQTITQQMAPLPGVRVGEDGSQLQPFFASGLDYCGPFTLRVGGPRSKITSKTYSLNLNM